MSQLSLAFDASLMIRDEQGRYLPATAEQILDAARKVIDQKVQRGAAFTSSELVKEYLIAKLGGFEHEVFSALFLDAKHRLIQYVEMFRGTIDSASVYPREVVKEALRLNAAAVICNRPGNTPPRFFQLAAWCPPVFGGHHFKPFAEDLSCQANAAPIPNPSRPRSSRSVPSLAPRLPVWP